MRFPLKTVWLWGERAFIRLAFWLAAVTAIPAEPNWTLVRPQDTGEALINPDMGWTLQFYSNYIENYGSRLEPSDTLDDWPGLSVIYLRVPWAFLEPREGEFNWSLFDTPGQRWIAKGKRIALRVSCCESWLRYATPKWVEDAGAKGVEFEFGKGVRTGGPLWEPDYLDPVFLQKLENFLATLARRYDGNANVAFIDIGSFGMWGEGHTLFSSKLSEEKTLETARRHIDLHVKHFTKTLLAISDDVAGATKAGAHLPETDYALSHGVTLRDDSIMVSQRHPWYHAELAQAFWPRLPVIVEHEHYGGAKARGSWNSELLARAVEEYHASYLSIHWWPREELNENREAVKRINHRLGYRIQLREIKWPSEVALGDRFTVETSWVNAGVAPCYGGGFLAFTLKDQKGGIVSVHVDENFDARTLRSAAMTNASPHAVRSDFVLARGFSEGNATHTPSAEPGEYDVFVSVGRRDGTPQIALPLPNGDEHRRYKVGVVKVTKRQ